MDTADLITLDQLREDYGFTIAAGSKTEAMYARLITAASLACLHFVGRDIHLREVTEYQDGNGHDRLILDEKPVASITELCIDPARGFSQPLAPSLYRVESTTGIVTLYGVVTPDVKDCVKVVYTAGYDTIPADVQAAVADTIQMMARRITGVSGGVTARTMADGGTEQLETTAPTDYAKFLLRSYRRNLVR